VLLDKPVASAPVPKYGPEKHQKKYGTICALMRFTGERMVKMMRACPDQTRGPDPYFPNS
jgi:hypothetical protein